MCIRPGITPQIVLYAVQELSLHVINIDGDLSSQVNVSWYWGLGDRTLVGVCFGGVGVVSGIQPPT